MHGRIATALIAAAFLLLPAGAHGAPADDFAAVLADWRADGEIEPCRWTLAQLEHAALVTRELSDLAYSDFPAAVARELGRLRQGRCAKDRDRASEPKGGGTAPPLAPARPPTPAERAQSPAGRLRIARLGIRGPARREFVRIVNVGTRTASLGGATLRTGRRLGLRLPGRVKVRPGRAVTVYVRCLGRARRGVVRGARIYACSKRRALFADRGDMAQLLDRRGTVVSQRGAGTRARVPRF